MNPHISWYERTQGLSPEQMRLLAGTLTHHINGLHLHLPDLLVLQSHYYRAALMYTLTHNSAIRATHLQVRRSYLFECPPHGLSAPDALTPATLAAFTQQLRVAAEADRAVTPEQLTALGLQPAHFRDLLALTEAQASWDDLLDVQLRHFDPKGMWHVIVLFPNPRGEELRLHLKYRDAEAYGLAAGLSPDPVWALEGAPSTPGSLDTLCALTGLDARGFPVHLTPTN